MPRPRKLKPDYCLDKSSGRAYVTLDGHRKYLGKHGTPESRDKYDQVIGEWIAAGRIESANVANEPEGLTVSEIIAGFWEHASRTYPPPTPTKPGKAPTGELGNFFYALKPLRRLYGPTPVLKFGPVALKAVRDEMIEIGWCRRHINKQVGRLRMLFAWAVENELLPGESLYRLQAVKGLRHGRSSAKETKPVRPVPAPHVDAVLSLVSDQVAAMIKLELLCGARGGELCAMRVKDIDTTGDVWIYKPEHHKTLHHGHERIIRFGDRCKQILKPLIQGKLDLSAFVFSPAEAEQQRRGEMRVARKSPIQPSQIRRAEIARSRQRRRAPGDHYTSSSYRHAVQRACDAAFPPPLEIARSRGESVAKWMKRLTPEQQKELKAWRRAHRWHPHQLRHSFATNVRRDFGPDAANILLGHSTMSATQIYAAIDEEKAQQIIAQVG